MKTPFVLPVLIAFLAAAMGAHAAHPFLCTDSAGGKVALVSAEGKIEWKVAYKHPQDCWRLPNGNILFSHVSGAIEMTREKKIVWEYKAPEKTEVHACQPLPDGNVMVVETGTCRIVEVDRAGKIAKEIKLPVPPASVRMHNQFRGVRKTKDGHHSSRPRAKKSCSNSMPQEWCCAPSLSPAMCMRSSFCRTAISSSPSATATRSSNSIATRKLFGNSTKTMCPAIRYG